MSWVCDVPTRFGGYGVKTRVVPAYQFGLTLTHSRITVESAMQERRNLLASEESHLPKLESTRTASTYVLARA